MSGQNHNPLLIPPGNRLKALKGNRKGQHPIRINDQWRICFTWSGSDARDVGNHRLPLNHHEKAHSRHLRRNSKLRFSQAHGPFHLPPGHEYPHPAYLRHRKPTKLGLTAIF
jgi:hypothetical protein